VVPHLIEAWRARLAPLCAQREWAGASLHPRRLPGGVVLGLRAPADLRDLAERAALWALEGARARLSGRPYPEDNEEALLRSAAAARMRPALRALEMAASRRGVALLRDDKTVSVGMGAGSVAWPAGRLPAPEDVDWTRVHDVPVAVLTGGAGVRRTGELVARMITAGGRCAGRAGSAGLFVADETLSRQTCADAAGARRILRDPRVELAVIEVAPERLLREGVGFAGADSAAVVAAAPDPAAAFDMALAPAPGEVELAVVRALRPGSPLALDLDDPAMVAAGPMANARIHWFTRDPDSRLAQSHVRAGGDLAALLDGIIVRTRSGSLVPVVPLGDVAGAEGDEGLTAVLAAVALASGLGLPWRALAGGLRGDTSG
ncbi:MAG TPA: hypothetical protein VMK65_07065, partial [Longimicrobiales bacterium]|nr:hypothetical protein [Longimicrobiales bacterium]